MLAKTTINALHLAMDMEVIKNQLYQNWNVLKSDDAHLIDCQLIRVYPQKGIKVFFNLHYDITLKTQQGIVQQQLWAELVGKNALEYCQNILLSLRKSRRTQLNKKDRDSQVFCVSDLGLVFRLWGLDDQLAGLKLLHKPKLLKPLLAQAMRLDENQIYNLQVDILGHRLGKRCIARINYQQKSLEINKNLKKSIIIKLYKQSMNQGSNIFDLNIQLWNHGYNQNNIRIPEPLAYFNEWNMFLMEDVSGALITEQATDNKETALKQTAIALAKFHLTPLKVSNIFTPKDEISLLENWVRITSQVFPSNKLYLNTAFNQIKQELTSIQQFNPCLVHRDFYEKQILLDGFKTTIIDFDTTCLSDPAIDLGNYLAHIVLLHIQGIETPINSEEIFLSAYDDKPTEIFFKKIQIYKRSTLLRLTCLYSFWPKWRKLVTKGLLSAISDN